MDWTTGTLALIGIGLCAAFVNGALGYGFSSLTVPVALLFHSNRVLNPASPLGGSFPVGAPTGVAPVTPAMLGAFHLRGYARSQDVTPDAISLDPTNRASLQRYADGIFGGQGKRLVLRVGMQRLCAAEHCRQGLVSCAHDIVVGLLCGERRTRCLGMETQHH